MNAQDTKSGFTFEQQIRSISIPENLRNEVLRQARVAQALLNAIARACEKIARARAERLMKSGVYYWE